MIVKVFFLCLFLLISTGSADSMAYRFVGIGDPYPPFCAEQFKGNRVCSDRFDAKILVLSFFILDQDTSRRNLRELQEIHAKYADKNVSVVGILSGNPDLKSLDEFIEANNIDFPILLDRYREIYGSFGVLVYPATGIFDRDKRLKYYLPARRLNFGKHAEGYIQFLSGQISQDELKRITHPPLDETDPNLRKAENYYKFAKISLERGRLDKAIELLELSIRLYDRYAPAYSLYGYIHIQREEYQLGLEKFDSALDIDPNLKEARTGKQLCKDKLKE